MPQLDSLSYFTQYFWLILTFFTFYYINANYIIPSLSKIFKVRNNLKLAQTEEDSDSKFEFEKVILNSIENSKIINNNTLNSNKDWLSSTLQKTNQENLKVVNSKYLNTIGNLFVKKNTF